MFIPQAFEAIGSSSGGIETLIDSHWLLEHKNSLQVFGAEMFFMDWLE